MIVGLTIEMNIEHIIYEILWVDHIILYHLGLPHLHTGKFDNFSANNAIRNWPIIHLYCRL